jgi:hypothetical protein
MEEDETPMPLKKQLPRKPKKKGGFWGGGWKLLETCKTLPMQWSCNRAATELQQWQMEATRDLQTLPTPEIEQYGSVRASSGDLQQSRSTRDLQV